MEAVVTFALDRLVRLSCEVLDAPVGFAGLLEPGGHMLVVTHGLPAGSAYPGSELDEPVERVLSTNRPLIVCDSHSHDRGDGAVAPVDPGVRAYIGVPVLGPGGDSLGALCVMDRRPHDWNDHELALLGGLAEVAAAEVLAAPLVSKAHG